MYTLFCLLLDSFIADLRFIRPTHEVQPNPVNTDPQDFIALLKDDGLKLFFVFVFVEFC